MSGKKNRDSKTYLYAVISGGEDRSFDVRGIDEGEVYAVSNGKVAVVASMVTDRKLRPERRHLAAHQRVLKYLMTETTPLPMAFGILADDSREAIRRILTINQAALRREINHVAGKIEMGVRVVWDVPNIFEYFVHKNSEIRKARDRFTATGEPTQDNKIELGRLFDQVLNEDRDQNYQMIEEVLSGCCAEIKRNSCRSEHEVMNLACLVGRDAQDKFEAGIFEAAQKFDNNFTFDFNGPWAPHNFVNVEINFGQ